jgi:hypothetical protein
MNGKYIVANYQPGLNALYEFRGKSTFIKPKLSDYQDLGFGSVLIEIDTGNVYFFDTEIDDWINPF